MYSILSFKNNSHDLSAPVQSGQKNQTSEKGNINKVSWDKWHHR